MGVTQTNSIAYKLVASGSILDLFDDEDILVSDNITGLFDIGTLPVDFSRTILLPGTKANNAFFEHVYDISIDAPYLFATNVKVPAYLDFDGIYLVSGYIQLNKVNLKGNLGIESYEVSVYGTVSSFARDINRFYLTDLTSLSKFNHTSSFNNISSSWDGGLFSGSIVYPLADYGEGWSYTTTDIYYGLDDNVNPSAGITVQDFKPAIRIKEVWDSIFDTFGYTYSSSFWQQEWLDNVYMICNNSLKYPEYSGVDLENYGVVKISPISGSGQTDLVIPSATTTILPWYNTQKDPSNAMGSNASYTLPISSSLQGTLNLNIKLSGSYNGAPALELTFKETSSLATSTIVLPPVSQFFTETFYSRYSTNAAGGVNDTYEVATEYVSPMLPPGTYQFAINWVNQFNPPYNNITFTLDPGDKPKSFLTVDKVRQAADNRVMDIPSNMPFGTTGIKLVDFVKGIQKKFNLVIYPNKTKSNELIVETYNNWFNKGKIKNFNNYINLDGSIDVTPANNLAVNKVTFGDKLDGDYVSQQFSKAANRTFGTSYYTDTQNFFSQGELKVETTFGVSPLLNITGTGLSGSVSGATPTTPTQFFVGECKFGYTFDPTQTCSSPAVIFTYTTSGTLYTGQIAYRDQYGTQPITGLNFITGPSGGTIYELNSSTGMIGSETGYYC
jgi:hypothetical protein